MFTNNAVLKQQSQTERTPINLAAVLYTCCITGNYQTSPYHLKVSWKYTRRDSVFLLLPCCSQFIWYSVKQYVIRVFYILWFSFGSRFQRYNKRKWSSFGMITFLQSYDIFSQLVSHMLSVEFCGTASNLRSLNLTFSLIVRKLSHTRVRLSVIYQIFTLKSSSYFPKTCPKLKTRERSEQPLCNFSVF